MKYYTVDRIVFDINAQRIYGDMGWTFNEGQIKYRADVYKDIEEFISDVKQDIRECKDEDYEMFKECGEVTIYQVLVHEGEGESHSQHVHTSIAVCSKEEGTTYNVPANHFIL